VIDDPQSGQSILTLNDRASLGAAIEYLSAPSVWLRCSIIRAIVASAFNKAAASPELTD
jgi:hypothetical protein